MQPLHRLCILIFLILAIPIRLSYASDPIGISKNIYRDIAGKDLSTQTGKKELSKKFEEHFNFDVFYFFTIQDIYNQLDDQQIASFGQAFKRCFFLNLEQQADKFIIGKIKKPNFTIIGSKDKTTMISITSDEFGKSKNVTFFIENISGKLSDLEIDHVLLSRQYRGQFNRIFRNGGFEGLIKDMKAAEEKVSETNS